MMDGHRWTPRDSNYRIGSRRSATPLLVWREKKSSASPEALAADTEQSVATHGGTLASHQGCLCVGVSGRAHFGQSRAADGRPDPRELSGTPFAHAGTENEPGRTQYGYRSFCEDHRERGLLVCFSATMYRTCLAPIMIWSIVLASPV